MDKVWWSHYLEEIERDFAGMRCSHGVRSGVQRVRGGYFREGSQNSGAGAIALAAEWGAKRIILLGYDCQKTGGKAHWHGDHPAKNRKGERMGNAGSIGKWPEQFRRLRQHLRGATVINASRETALSVFPRMPLEEALA